LSIRFLKAILHLRTSPANTAWLTDVLTLINWINAHPTSGTLPAPPSEPPASYSDVDDYGRCTAGDVLLVINWLNSQLVV